MIRVTQITVLPSHNKIYDLGVYSITIDDEGGGEYLVLEEQQDGGSGKVKIDPEQWPELRDAIERILGEMPL